MSPQATPSGGQLGAMLRHWRDLRRKSQLELSLDTGVSQRHLSFIEVGRSLPSRQMLIDIATALDMPLRDRNTLLLAGGYAPVYPDMAWDGPEMRSITSALDRMLRQHEPFPALVMDRYWNVVRTNRAAPRLFNRFTDLSARKAPRNLLHLVFDPAGLRPYVADWPRVAESLIQRVYRESVGRVIDDKIKGLLEELMAYPDVEPAWTPPKATTAQAVTPVVPIGLVKDGKLLNYFSMVATVGTPQTIAAQELRIECMFPADEATEALHLALLGEAPG